MGCDPNIYLSRKRYRHIKDFIDPTHTSRVFYSAGCKKTRFYDYLIDADLHDGCYLSKRGCSGRVGSVLALGHEKQPEFDSASG